MYVEIQMSANTHITDYKDQLNFKCKYIVVDAPPGCGKSYFMSELKKRFKRIWFLVPEKALVEDIYKYEWVDKMIAGRIKSDKGSDKLTVINYDQFISAKNGACRVDLNKGDLIIIDEAHALIEDSSFRNIMNKVRDFILKNTNSKIFLSGTVEPFVSWLDNNQIQYDHYKFLLHTKNKKNVIVKPVLYPNVMFVRIKELFKYLIETNEDYGIHFFYNDKKKLFELRDWLIEEMKLDFNEIRIITTESDRKDFNRTLPKVYLTTKAVERGVSSLGNITEFIGCVGGNGSIYNYIQGMNRERLNQVRNWCFFLMKNKAVEFTIVTNLFSLKKELQPVDIRNKLISLIHTHNEIDDELQQRIDKVTENGLKNVTDVNICLLKYIYYYHLSLKNLYYGFNHHQIKIIKASLYDKFKVWKDTGVSKSKENFMPFFEDELLPNLDYFKELLYFNTNDFNDIKNNIFEHQNELLDYCNYDDTKIVKMNKLLLYYYAFNYFIPWKTNNINLKLFKRFLQVDLNKINAWVMLDFKLNKEYKKRDDIIMDLLKQLKQWGSHNSSLNEIYSNRDLRILVDLKYKIVSKTNKTMNSRKGRKTTRVLSVRKRE